MEDGYTQGSGQDIKIGITAPGKTAKPCADNTLAISR